jgi:hypothetical protein
MGAVATGLTWAVKGATVKAYCNVDGTSNDTVLEALFKAAVAKADLYLNNPFETYNPTIVLSGVAANDWITVNGQTYTAAVGAVEEDLEFEVGATDSLTADNLCARINSTTLGGSYGCVGVPDITATNATGTITLTRRYPYPNSKRIEVESADDETMMVRQVRTALSLPDEILQWVCQYVFRHFRNPAAMASENEVGMYAMGGAMVETYDLIAQYRLSPGF